MDSKTDTIDTRGSATTTTVTFAEIWGTAADRTVISAVPVRVPDAVSTPSKSPRRDTVTSDGSLDVKVRAVDVPGGAPAAGRALPRITSIPPPATRYMSSGVPR